MTQTALRDGIGTCREALSATAWSLTWADVEPKLREARDALARELAVQTALRAAPVRFSHVLQVTFTAGDPQTAANGANNAMDAYIKGLYADRHRKVEEAKGQFEGQARALRTTVQQSEEKIALYRTSHALSQGIHAGTETEQITRLLEELELSHGNDEIEMLMELDATVHRFIYRCAGNPFLEETLDRYLNLSLRIWYLVIDRLPHLFARVHEHEEVLRAIAVGDAPRAREILTAHIATFEREIRSVL